MGQQEVIEELMELQKESGSIVQPIVETPGGLGGILGSVGGMFGPAGLAGGGFDLASSAESRAVSGGPFQSGDITFGLKTNTLAIAGAVVLGLYLLFGRK
ncbi:hypothetical protein ES703_41563 [subsurface metagenome]